MSGWNFTIENCSSVDNCSHNESGSVWYTDKTPIDVQDIVTLLPCSITFLVCTFVLIVLFKSGEARKCPGHLLIANATFGDLVGVSVLSVRSWVYAHPMTMTESNKIICKVYYFFFVFMHAWTGWSCAVLAYDRYDMVARPLNRKLTLKKAKLCVVAIIVFCALWAACPLIGWSEYRLQINGACSMAYTVDIPEEIGSAMFTLLFFTINYITPLSIDVICFIRVLIIALSHMRRKRSFSRRVSRHSTSVSESTDNARVTSPLAIIASRPFIVVTTTIASDVLLSAPYLIILVLRKVGVIPRDAYIGVVQVVRFGMHLTAYNHLFNAVLYTIFVKNIISSAFPCLKRYKKNKRINQILQLRVLARNKTSSQQTCTTPVVASADDVFECDL
ncbi:rhodopsin-like [Corticium candelabrum]|uniref:rhodopsin-like n=1 Tax=Corticium candelabrum TaxID=121492 RepID=UPI002E2530DA|nr:rhodopsin-like [Corticium candelabrum]